MQGTYGTGPHGAGPRDPGVPKVKPKIGVMAKIIPCIFLCIYIPMVFLASQVLRAEEQEEQNMYAIEEDTLYNRSIPFVEWQGNHWVDEATGKTVQLPCFLPDGTKCDSESYKDDRQEDRLLLDSDEDGDD
eukprot:CAMPEP_0113710270 /NCGR_PEP_ID=MMETSP0038_2-20120614/30058_1 /TAXON_ID=2898 /ORGANISM="Cryptomonas paramecium" /LENGTH=130 /DNA_ID=CAMNT_0000636297 /DNA_START=56 /DNA_END=445 /DNA_ORIENTATION=+ /assembly_acc=CAM_ASM_000170